MTPERYQCLCNLFDQAQLVAPAEQEAFVCRACAGDPALQAEFQKMLRHDVEARRERLFQEPCVVTREVFGPTDEPADALLGRWVGPYLIEQCLGSGGMGSVYRARREGAYRQRVALKVTRPGLESEEVVHRFQTERQALADLEHPHIARLLDGGTSDDGRPYIVMEYIDGQPLDRYAESRQPSTRERVQLVQAVCAAVQYAHARGVIHRDLKPGNVLVTADGTPRVTDFGLAKRLAGEVGQTQSGAILGTPSYMAPEQAAGQNKKIGVATDVYALGALLYELLTGRPPFRGETPLETLRQVVDEDPVPPGRLHPRLPRDLETICLKCLQKDPAKRYRSAEALGDDLRRFLGGEPIHARPVRAWERGWRWCRRNPGLAFATTTAALLLVAIAVVASLSAWWLSAEQKATQEQLHQTQEAERRGKYQLFQAKLSQAQARRWSRQIGQRWVSWQALTEAAELARELGLDEDHVRDLRNEAIASLALADVRFGKQEWEGFPAGSSGGVAFDAGLERYARSDLQGNISVRRVEGDRELARLPGDGPGASGSGGAAVIKFSPDGTLLAVRYWHQLPGQPTNFQLWDWQRRKIIFEPSFSGIEALDFSPDGRHLALGRPGVLTIHQTDTGKIVKVMDLGGGFTPSCLAFHPDGRTLAVASRSGRWMVRLLNVATGNRLIFYPNLGAAAWAIAWHPDGVLLAAACADGDIYIWNTATKQQHAVLHGHQNAAVSVVFAPGGDLLLSAAWDGTSRLWDPWTGRELLRFPGDARHFSHDGRRLARRVGYHLAVGEVAPGREYRTLPRVHGVGKEEISDGGFSPDGRWLAIATTQGVRLWDLAQGKELLLLGASATTDAKFHASGQALFTSGSAGLYRWPWQTRAGVLRIGPAHKLPVPGPLQRFGLDREGRILAVVDVKERGYLINLEDPSGKVRPLPHVNAWSAAVSPDGRWVATGTFHGFGVKVWEAATGKLAFPDPLIPDVRNSRVAFSPDGRWLAIGTPSEIGFWDVGTWQPARQLRRKQEVPGHMAFSPDGQILALTISLTVVQLIDPETGRPYAQLEAPDSDPVELVGFSPDGSQLVITTLAGHVRVWDLRQIRAQLQPVGLDWDQPPYPPPANQDAKPLEVKVVGALEK